jgi:hypothetical protein
MQNVPRKCWRLSTKLHGVTLYKRSCFYVHRRENFVPHTVTVPTSTDVHFSRTPADKCKTCISPRTETFLSSHTSHKPANGPEWCMQYVTSYPCGSHSCPPRGNVHIAICRIAINHFWASICRSDRYLSYWATNL